LEEELGTPADLKRSEIHRENVSWMRRNEYISTENTRFQPKNYDSAEAKVGYGYQTSSGVGNKRKIDTDFYKDRQSQIEAIENSFELAKKPVLIFFCYIIITTLSLFLMFNSFFLYC
jgi:hypothetical protein